MTDAYLEAVIAWLEEHKEFLWSTELQAVPQLVPGPAIAYEGPDDWLEDQFLMRSLRAEHQRRVHAHEEAT